jgi:hypothetical protein
MFRDMFVLGRLSIYAYVPIVGTCFDVTSVKKNLITSNKCLEVIFLSF